MNRTEAVNYIKQRINCADYLKPAPNHHNNTGFICPACGSGSHNGSRSTGAVEFYPSSNTWYCHSCKAGGDIIDIIRYQNKSGYTEALDELAKLAGINIDGKAEHYHYKGNAEVNAGKSGAEGVTASDPEEKADYIDYYIKCADDLEKPEALEYLKKRGISLQTARRLLIGFDPAADPAAAPGATGNEEKKHPEPRIIAPCTNDFYIARATDPAAPPQYKAINPTGSHTQIFNAGAIYNRRTNYCFVVEGLFDALSVEEHGAEAIALSSCSNGNLLIEMLKDRPAIGKVFIICFDADTNPDTRAKVTKKADELADELTRMNYKAIVFNICGMYTDPNEAAVNDPGEFENALSGAELEADRDELDDFINKVTTPAYKPIKTNLTYFDELTGGGILAQTLTVLMAQPASGKTLLMQNLAEAMAANNPERDIIFINLEMSREQLIARAISARLYKRGRIRRTALQILQGYKWTAQERKEIEAAINDYRREVLPHLQYNPAKCGADLDGIAEYLKTIAEAAKAQHKPGPVIVIDYLQLINSEKQQDIKETIKQALLMLKAYAVENNTIVFLVSAVSRKENEKITMASARDTSNIEYTADYEFSLENYKQENVADKQRRQVMILKVLKSRLTAPGGYSILMRDGSNNIFLPKYTGHVKEPNAAELPEWTQGDEPADLDDEQLMI